MAKPAKRQVREQTLQILSDTLKIHVDDDRNVLRDEIGEWDSIKHLELILALEEHFNVRFSAEQVGSIRSLQDILQILDDQL